MVHFQTFIIGVNLRKGAVLILRTCVSNTESILAGCVIWHRYIYQVQRLHLKNFECHDIDL